jgi:hypothetical protein
VRYFDHGKHFFCRTGLPSAHPFLYSKNWILKEEKMQITLTLDDRELKFLSHMIEQDVAFEKKETTLEDAIHECISRVIYDEGETTAQDEGI